MRIENIEPFYGEHCEATATGTLLKHIGINLSEPMIFGLGEGLSFFYWKMTSMKTPLFLGRTKPLSLTQRLSDNFELNLEIKETSSIKKAWNNAKEKIDSGIPVGLKLDMHYLDYFDISEHFAGHFVAMYGYDNDFAYLIDWKGLGSKMKTSLKSLELARNSNAPMSSKNLSYILESQNKSIDLKKLIIEATRRNSDEYLNPPISNLGFKGIIKAGKELGKCLKKSDYSWNLNEIADFIENAGTGGAIFRNFYRDYLNESYKITENDIFYKCHLNFVDIAKLWNDFTKLLILVEKEKEYQRLKEASEILFDIAEKEKNSMMILSKI